MDKEGSCFIEKRVRGFETHAKAAGKWKGKRNSRRRHPETPQQSHWGNMWEVLQRCIKEQVSWDEFPKKRNNSEENLHFIGKIPDVSSIMFSGLRSLANHHPANTPERGWALPLVTGSIFCKRLLEEALVHTKQRVPWKILAFWIPRLELSALIWNSRIFNNLLLFFTILLVLKKEANFLKRMEVRSVCR